MNNFKSFVTEEMLNFIEEITSERIQAYLEKINSWLKNKMCSGKPFSLFLYDLCATHKVNQIWMLATIQKEQSALFRITPPSSSVQNKILGYAIMESGKLPGYDGFEKQFTSAIRQFKRYDEWEQVKNYTKIPVKLYDDAEDRAELKTKDIPFTEKYVATNKGEAKALLYTPRLAPLVQMGELYKKIDEVI